MLEDLYVSYDITEKDKDPTDPSKLGHRLLLCEHRYSELDEIVDRFIESITIVVSSITSFSKYRNLTDVGLMEELINQ